MRGAVADGVDVDVVAQRQRREADAAVGEATAVIGPSGSGKSTLADIVTGLIRPTSGALRLDGVPLGRDQARSWRDLIAYVPQETFLGRDTIRENLRAAVPDADEARLWRALEKAAAAEFVAALPGGLDARIGERGASLSGGERQRLALARALLRRPALLVLDEATSALDWEGQARIAEALRGLDGETTVLTIAHRPSMIGVARTVYTLLAGRVVEAGARDALVRDPESHLARMLAHEAGADAP